MLYEGAPPHVRMAKPNEEDAIFSILKTFHEENALHPLCEWKVRDRIKQGLAGYLAGILVIDGTDEIAATVGFAIGEAWYTEERSINEYWFYVRPAYRNSHYAEDLIDVVKAMSDRLALPAMMGVTSTHRTEAKLRLYRRRMTTIGGLFMHGIEHASGPLALRMRDDDVRR